MKKIKTLGNLSLFLFLNMNTVNNSLSAQTWISYGNTNKTLTKTFNGIAIDANNSVWLATNNGVVSFDGNNWTSYNTSNSLMPSGTLTSIVVDSKNRKWIGTLGKGIAVLESNDCKIYNMKNSGLPSDYVKHITIDATGKTWIASNKGVTVFDGGTWNTYNVTNSGLPSNICRTIAIDKKGNKWIGTDNGLAIFDGSKWTNYNTLNSDLGNKTINCITMDENNTAWIGTNDGIYTFDGTTWKTFTRSNSGIQDDYIYSIVVDKKDRKWIGSNANGLSMLDGANWTRYDNTNTPTLANASAVSQIGMDKDGNLWFGAYNAHLYGFTTNAVTSVSKVSGKTRSVQLYPNPNKGTFSINGNVGNIENVHIEIVNSVGQLVYQNDFPVNNGLLNSQINVANISQGIYILRVCKPNSTEITHFVIQ